MCFLAVCLRGDGRRIAFCCSMLGIDPETALQEVVFQVQVYTPQSVRGRAGLRERHHPAHRGAQVADAVLQGIRERV